MLTQKVVVEGAVASTSKTYMDRLERIQNSALRIAIGARNTSPIQALQAEANLPPLRQHIRGVCCKTFFRMRAHEHPILESMENDNEVVDRVWTRHFKTPFIVRCGQILSSLEITYDIYFKDVMDVD